MEKSAGGVERDMRMGSILSFIVRIGGDRRLIEGRNGARGRTWMTRGGSSCRETRG